MAIWKGKKPRNRGLAIAMVANYLLRWPSKYPKVKIDGLPIPKGRYVKGPYKPICRDRAIYFSITVLPQSKGIPPNATPPRNKAQQKAWSREPNGPTDNSTSIAVSGSLNRWDRWYIITQLAVYTTYTPLIVLANWMIIRYRSHLLREPGNSIEYSPNKSLWSSFVPIPRPKRITIPMAFQTEARVWPGFRPLDGWRFPQR